MCHARPAPCACASWHVCGTSAWLWASLSVLADGRCATTPGLHCGLLLWTPEKSFNFSGPIRQVQSLLAERQAWFTAVSGGLRGAPFMVTALPLATVLTLVIRLCKPKPAGFPRRSRSCCRSRFTQGRVLFLKLRAPGPPSHDPMTPLIPSGVGSYGCCKHVSTGQRVP